MFSSNKRIRKTTLFLTISVKTNKSLNIELRNRFIIRF